MAITNNTRADRTGKKHMQVDLTHMLYRKLDCTCEAADINTRWLAKSERERCGEIPNPTSLAGFTSSSLSQQ